MLSPFNLPKKSSVLIFLAALLLACSLPQSTTPGQLTADPAIGTGANAVMTPFRPATRAPGDPILTPTPDAPHRLPSLRNQAESYTVQSNDTLGGIAAAFGISLEALLAANDLPNPDLLSVGQILTIPAPIPGAPGPSFKIIPDSELVNGPANAVFKITDFVSNYGGYLATYQEEVDGQILSGALVVDRIARDYSVNPRLLLAVLEHQSGWLTLKQPRLETLAFPISNGNNGRQGLYRQLAWAADNLNHGYYLWRVDGIGFWITTDGVFIPADSTLNPGTAGIQHLFSLLYDQAAWRQAVSETGFFSTFSALFGYPFDWAIEPIVPPGLSQPSMQLPFEPNTLWVFTGGPHGGWDSGSAWAALDFAPPAEELGCVQNDAWVVAAADGLILRAENGAVVQDLDGDGFEQTGWTILYMHVESRERVSAGTFLRAGERIGHPSCEGGISSGTHLHLARRYNGEWIPADGPLPLVMDGWTSVGSGRLYDGFLVRGEESIEACECKEPENMLQR